MHRVASNEVEEQMPPAEAGPPLTESEQTLSMYGVGKDATDAFGRKCLMARRFAEAGVRFIELIDFTDPSNNDWVVTNQFTVVEGKYNRRPDVVVFVNGLPIAVVELKNAAGENATVEAAFDQLQTYKAQTPSLFRTNGVLIVSDGLTARMGSLTADQERCVPDRRYQLHHHRDEQPGPRHEGDGRPDGRLDDLHRLHPVHALGRSAGRGRRDAALRPGPQHRLLRSVPRR